jgi:hypothetical protein
MNHEEGVTKLSLKQYLNNLNNKTTHLKEVYVLLSARLGTYLYRKPCTRWLYSLSSLINKALLF